jgi:hypothetical protein
MAQSTTSSPATFRDRGALQEWIFLYSEYPHAMYDQVDSDVT